MLTAIASVCAPLSACPWPETVPRRLRDPPWLSNPRADASLRARACMRRAGVDADDDICENDGEVY